MIQRSKELYNELKHALEEYMSNEGQCLANAEKCFRISNAYWAILREELETYKFETAEEEIRFFKTIKPLFTSEIEYYAMLHHAGMFLPDQSGSTRDKEFWTRQLVRLDNFMSANAAFYQYYVTGSVHNDAEYFMRNYLPEADTSPKPLYYFQDGRSSSSHDHIIASILALHRYIAFVKRQLTLASA